MTDLTTFRVYEPWECGKDGYPEAWHASVKHVVRAAVSHRCQRCGHPYVVGESAITEAPEGRQDYGRALADPNGSLLKDIPYLEDGVAALRTARAINWSRCDERCTHPGPIRYRESPQHGPSGEQVGGAWLYEEDGSPSHVWELEPHHEVQAAWRILTVHHLNGNKADLRWWNLAALCQRCHLFIQRKVIMERVYPFEHTEWFKPHAAGWYAYAYLGENVGREEAFERMDELLALERMV